MSDQGVAPDFQALAPKMFLRSFLIQAWWSFEGMQNLGFLFALDPWLRRAHADPEALREARARHLEYFNTQPYMAGYVLGVSAGLEERLAGAPPEERAALAARLKALKAALASSLAALGDAFFWGALKPAAAAFGLLAAVGLWTLGAGRPVLWGCLAYLAAFNLPALRSRWQGLGLGYRLGEQLPGALKAQGWQGRIRLARRLGLAAAAALALSALAVPPLGGAPGWGNALLLALCVAFKALGGRAAAGYGALAAWGAAQALWTA